MPPSRGPVPIVKKEAEKPTDGDLVHDILQLLSDKESFTTSEAFPNASQPEIKAALDRVGSRSMVVYETHDTDLVLLTPEAETICEEGSHEYKVWDAVREKGTIPIKELPQEVGAESAKIGSGAAFKNKWIKKVGDSLVLQEQQVVDKTRELLQKVQETKAIDDSKLLADLRKRKLVTLGKEISYTVRKGPKYATEIQHEATDLTVEMLQSGDWESTSFKAYNFKALGTRQNGGAFHPLNKVRAELREIFLRQGFVEMPTNRFVETGFWNFDTLYVPQQHPARDLQDTFYISDPPTAGFPDIDPPAEAAMTEMEKGARTLYATKEKRDIKPRDFKKYFENIRAVHEGGDDRPFGTVGYRYDWSEEECLKLVLRTHTTAVSAWALHRLAEDPRPVRYFSIDRVFRNETVDATHLAEFHQVEGVIADFGLTLGGLMKFLEDFFSKLGITGLRFKPAYNPYTEPSMEIFGYHGGLGRWVEIGNSGMFRPEMLETAGLPADMRVYGFGLSLERPTMIRYGVSNIRDLLGHKVDLGFIENNAAVRLDKN